MLGGGRMVGEKEEGRKEMVREGVRRGRRGDVRCEREGAGKMDG